MGFLDGRRPLQAALIAGAALASLHAPASAQNWSEPKYNPEIGSRWLLVSQSDSEDNRQGGQSVTQHIAGRAEITIEEKLPGGFRVSSVNRAMDVSGAAPGLALAATAFSAMKDIVIKARTDASGKPVVVENYDEVKANMRTVIDRLAQGFDKNPQAAAMIRQLMAGFLLGTDTDAARNYLEGMPILPRARRPASRPARCGATRSRWHRRSAV
jgi:hypothetical protein